MAASAPPTRAPCSRLAPRMRAGRLEQRLERLDELPEWHRQRLRSGRDEVRGPGRQLRLALTYGGAQPAPGSVPDHGAARPSADAVGHPRRCVIRARDAADRDRASTVSRRASEGSEGCTAADAPDQADRRERPRRRRDLSTARPLLARIRDRNPWRFLRRRVLGWNVRFTHGLLARNRPRGPEVRGRSSRANNSVYDRPRNSRNARTRTRDVHPCCH
jgi:hypothetical protein